MTFVHRPLRLAFASGLLLLAVATVSPAIAAEVGASIVDLAFEPATVTVAQGDTVTWTVTKSVGAPHSVTSGKPNEANAGTLFDSGSDGLKDDGQSFKHTFNDAGVFDYFCRVHPVDMTGQVVVTAAGGEAHEGIAPERKLAGAGILVVTLVVLFGASMLWRRMNPA